MSKGIEAQPLKPHTPDQTKFEILVPPASDV